MSVAPDLIGDSNNDESQSRLNEEKSFLIYQDNTAGSKRELGVRRRIPAFS